MAMQLVKKADGYKIFKRGDERYAVKDAFVSTVSLTVALTLPSFLPVPVAAFEKAGSQSIQKLLDQDMPITLSKFRDAYLAWEA